MKGLALALLLWQAGIWATGLPPYLLEDGQDMPAQDASSQDAKPAGD